MDKNECDKLYRSVMHERNELKDEVGRLQKLVDCKNRLLVCYRIGKRPSAALLRAIDELQSQGKENN